MNELIDSTPKELTEIEHFIQDLMLDITHPVNDPRHPQHDECIKALHELLERADMLGKSN